MIMVNKKYKNVEIKREKDFTVFTFKKTLDFDNFIIICEEFYNSNPTKNVLFDISAGDFKGINDKQTEIASQFLKDNFYRRPANAKTAFVVLGFDDLGRIKSWRFWNIVKGIGLNSKIFHDRKSAIDWINEGELG